MIAVRLCVLTLAGCVLAFGTGANAEPVKRERMPRLPQLGAHSDTLPPTISVPADLGRRIAGVDAVRLERTLRGVLASNDNAPTRGKREQDLFAKFGRSVVLVVLPEGAGSGAVIDNGGTILTNWHVVEGFKSVGVIFKPESVATAPRVAEAVEAKVLFVDEIADLALIRVAKLPKDVRPFRLGDHSKLAVGADVQAIGHPNGEAWSFTKGIVSQIRPDYEWRYQTGPVHRADVIQTQTPINPGNSGGPLLDNAGEIVGINTFGDSRAQQINFAVAATEIRRFIALKKDRRAPEAHAAADDAMPPAALPAAQAGSPTCEVKRVESRRSMSDDGTGHLLDTDCDGTVDAILVVPDRQREPVVLLIDANQNLAVEAVYVDEDHNFTFDYVLFDTDEDGVSDLIGVDLDQDLKPRRILATRA
jgi:hypothetical protein